MIDFDKIEFRCHALKSIMTDSKYKTFAEKAKECRAEITKLSAELDEAKKADKMGLKTNQAKKEKKEVLESELVELEKKKDSISDLLSQTTKSYLIDLFIEKNYHRTNEIESKYFEKGLQTEEAGITNISLNTGRFMVKNTQRFSNGYINGEPDVLEGEGLGSYTDVWDNKSSWSIFTFAKVKYGDQSVDDVYWWQLQGYGVLTGAKRLHLAYNLIDTPEPLVESEIKRLWYKLGQPNPESSDYIEAVAQLRYNLQYPDIDNKFKTHVISFDAEAGLEERINNRVILCREFMKFRFG